MGGGGETDTRNQGGGEAAEGSGGGRGGETDAGKGEAGGGETGGTVVRSNIAWVGEGGGAALVASPPEAGPSRAPPQKPKWTAKGAHWGPGIVIPEKNCTQCITQELLCWWDLEGHTQSCQLCRQLKKPCRRFKGLTEKGKRRVEDEGEGAGPSKRLRVRPMSEQMERRQTEWRRMEVEDLQVGSQVIEALWALNTRLGKIQAKLVAGQEATSESAWLLHCSIVYNLHQIEMMLVVWRDRSREEGEPEVKGEEEAEELGERAEEQME